MVSGNPSSASKMAEEEMLQHSPFCSPYLHSGLSARIKKKELCDIAGRICDMILRGTSPPSPPHPLFFTHSVSPLFPSPLSILSYRLSSVSSLRILFFTLSIGTSYRWVELVFLRKGFPIQRSTGPL